MSSATQPYAVRDSTVEDVSDIASIYSFYVLHDIATFETEPPSVSELQQRRQAALAAGGCHLVATSAAGAVIGFAYAGVYRPRFGYRFTLETSIYLQPECKGRGVGAALLQAVIARCRAGQCQQLVAVIAGNEQEAAASIALHRRLGFRLVGSLSRVGFKFDRWLDTAILQADIAH